MDLSKAVAGTAILLIIALAAGHALTQTTSHEGAQTPKAAQPPATARTSG